MVGPHDVPPCLRQGDVISDVFFPIPREADTRFIGNYTGGTNVAVTLQPLVKQPEGSRRQYLTAVTYGSFSHAAIISQCCDLDRAHPKPSFVLCKLVQVDRQRFRNVEALVNNVNPYGDVPPHLQFFFFGEIQGMDGEYAADYAFTTTIPWGDYDRILGRKILQLDPEHRNMFRVKVGAHFGRPSEEDVAAGLADPYAVQADPENAPAREDVPQPQNPPDAPNPGAQ